MINFSVKALNKNLMMIPTLTHQESNISDLNAHKNNSGGSGSEDPDNNIEEQLNGVPASGLNDNDNNDIIESP